MCIKHLEQIFSIDKINAIYAGAFFTETINFLVDPYY